VFDDKNLTTVDNMLTVHIYNSHPTAVEDENTAPEDGKDAEAAADADVISDETASILDKLPEEVAKDVAQYMNLTESK
jgi:hypothetical protein